MASIAPQEARPAGATSPWRGFRTGLWQKEINVRDFIQQNYEPYDGDEAFLAPATARTEEIWDQLTELFVLERKKGVLDVSQVPSSITAHAPGYIDRENEIIVGLQTEAPLKRAIMPNGGFRMVLSALKAYGYEPDPHVVEAFTKYRKTHNEAVFDAYTADIRHCRSSHVLTGLARRLRPRPHHRRLPARRALRRRAADRAEAAGEARTRRRDVDGRDHPRPRGALRADPGAQGAAADGRELRLRHLGAGGEREGSRAVALLRLPGGGEGAERRRHVARADLDLPRRLLRSATSPPARSPRRRPRRSSTTS